MKRSRDKRLTLALLRHPVHLLSFGFGSGYAPFAPGTFGTLVAVPVFMWLSQFSTVQYVVIVAVMFTAGIWFCNQTSQTLGVHDHKAIVWDEIVGYLITMLLITPSWLNICAGFALFRLFDIWKPWPINLLDKNVHGGLGIMLDDVLAGFFAWLVLQLVLNGLT